MNNEAFVKTLVELSTGAADLDTRLAAVNLLVCLAHPSPVTTVGPTTINIQVNTPDEARGAKACFTISPELARQIKDVEVTSLTPQQAATMRDALMAGSPVPIFENPEAKGMVDRPLVNRTVDPETGLWFDPDINAWRHGAVFNTVKGHWDFIKGTPL